MKNISCEEFEKHFADSGEIETDSSWKSALEEHRRDCPYCQRFELASYRLREAFRSIPTLDAPPFFLQNVLREIRRSERGTSRTSWRPAPQVRFLTISTGFAVALFLGFIFLRSGAPPGVTNFTQPNPSADNVLPSGNLQRGPVSIPTPAFSANPENPMFASGVSEIDTATHHLPEPPGTNVITIPPDDDLWRINQVSTTQGDP